MNTESVSHLIEHHRKHNFPISVAVAPNAGRFFIANKDIKKGETILEDYPYTTIVDRLYKHQVCGNCFKYFPERKLILKCDKCEFLHYCSEECRSQDNQHLPLECEAYKKYRESQFDNNLDSIVLLMIRCILKGEQEKQQNVKNSEFTFEDFNMLDGNEGSFPESTIQEFTKACHFVNKLVWGDDNTKYKKIDYLVSLLFKIECNSFGYWVDKSTGYATAIYLGSILFNHSCYPNIFKYHEEGTQKHIYLAHRDIKSGEAVTISYVDLIDPVDVRIKALQDLFCFTCNCPRCVDEINGGHHYDKFIDECVCKKDNCHSLLIELPSKVIICSTCGKLN